MDQENRNHNEESRWETAPSDRGEPPEPHSSEESSDTAGESVSPVHHSGELITPYRGDYGAGFNAASAQEPPQSDFVSPDPGEISPDSTEPSPDSPVISASSIIEETPQEERSSEKSKGSSEWMERLRSVAAGAADSAREGAGKIKGLFRKGDASGSASASDSSSAFAGATGTAEGGEESSSQGEEGKVPFRNRKWVMATVALLALILTAGILYKSFQGDVEVDTTALIPTVNSLSLKKRELVHTVNVPGTVTYLEKASVTSKILGRVESLKVDQGTMVKKGQTLAQMETFELKLKLDQAKAGVNSARANLTLAQARYKDSRRNVERELKGLDRMQSDIIDAKASFILSRENLANKKEIYDLGGVSRQEMKSIYADYIASASRYYQTRKQYQIGRVGFRNEDLSSSGSSIPKDPEKRRKSLIDLNTQVERSGVTVARAAYENALLDLRSAELYLKEAVIRSPLNGVVASRAIEVGEEVKQGEPLFTVVRTDRLLVSTGISENEVKYIRPGQDVDLVVDARDGLVMKGEVYQISPIIDVKTRTAEVKIAVNNEENLISPGMFVRTSIVTRRRKDGLALPENALLDRHVKGEVQKAKVFVIRDGMAFEKEVVLGEEFGTETEVISGLEAGEEVALGNLRVLKNGSRVRITGKGGNESPKGKEAVRSEKEKEKRSSDGKREGE